MMSSRVTCSVIYIPLISDGVIGFTINTSSALIANACRVELFTNKSRLSVEVKSTNLVFLKHNSTKIPTLFRL